jgi:putative hemolysin
MHTFSTSLPGRLPFGRKQPWSPLRPLWHWLTQLQELQHLYERHAHLTGREFIGQLLRDLQIKVECSAADLRRIPAQGAFMALANHPCGMLDGLVLLYVLSEVRPELVMVANELLAPLLPNLAAQLALVSPERKDAGRNTPGVRQLLRYLHHDVPLALFPAGAVAHRPCALRPALDPEWHPTAGRLLAVARVPVLPIWISGKNSVSFSLLGMVHPWLRTARLPAELLNKRGQTVRVRIGQAVPAAALALLPAPERLAYIRARVQALGAAWQQTPGHTARPPAPLRSPLAAEALAADIGALRPGRCLLRYQNWEVYVAKRAELPHILPEIGRLRELTFRGVGEGTSRETDLDQYDDYYQQLFLYNRASGQIVGGYRLGRGRSIVRNMGKRGFYLHSLFRMRKELVPMLRESLELGRSFVRPEYQKQPLPLLLLWKGIAEYIARHPEYRYLIGPVSISNQFSSVSKQVMKAYLEQHFSDPTLAAWVKPRKRYRPLAHPNSEKLQTGLHSVQDLHKLVTELEPGGVGVPVLLRHYLQQNARIIGFNVDPGFNNTLDGFLVVDARELPARTHHLLKSGC